MHRPSIREIFGLPNENGLSDILVGEADIGSAICKTKLDHLDFLPAGHIPPSPSELLASNRMMEIIEDLRTRYDYVLFDTPPIGIVTDATGLGRGVDGVVFVTVPTTVPKHLAGNLTKRLMEMNIPILGFLFNKTSDSGSGGHSYFYYYSQYYSYYGYGYGDYGQDDTAQSDVRTSLNRKRRSKSAHEPTDGESESGGEIQSRPS